MHHLACRMDACIGSPSGKGLQGRQRLELLDGTLQFGLNAVAIDGVASHNEEPSYCRLRAIRRTG